jgi:hypothetical protein
MERPRLTHVAIRFRDKVHSLPEPNRHADIIYQMIREDKEIDYMDIDHEGEFGFLDETGLFLNRKQALYSAIANDQIKDTSKVLVNQLYSEAIW